MGDVKKTVVFGLLGQNKDYGGGKSTRWEKWRPTIALCNQEDMLIDRFELLVQPESIRLAKAVVEDIARVSPETQVNVHEMGFDDPWDFEEVYTNLFDFIQGYSFNRKEEDYLIHITTGTHVAQIVWYLLAESKQLPGRLLQASPGGRANVAVGTYSIIDLDLAKYDKLAARFYHEHLEGAAYLKSGIQTRNEKFNKLIARVEQVAIRSQEPVLLMGPTGAGKSHLARRVFELKQQRNQLEGRFVEVNCATLRGDAAMSTLFGHVKGSFTGAAKDREGLLRAADGGVLFLDEIGELGSDEQAMLLRAIEDKRFMPLGADHEVSSDFQLIAGTNHDLLDDVHEGLFREDLLARINLWTFTLPGLRERREDIEPNLLFELERYTRESGNHVRFNQQAKDKYLTFALGAQAIWAANFRDLSASVTRMVTLSENGRITVDVVQEEIDRLSANWREPDDENGHIEYLSGYLSMEQLIDIDRFDLPQLAEVVKVCCESASIAEAGRTLFAVSRLAKKSSNDGDRLRKYLAKFNLAWDDLR